MAFYTLGRMAALIRLLALFLHDCPDSLAPPFTQRSSPCSALVICPFWRPPNTVRRADFTLSPPSLLAHEALQVFELDDSFPAAYEHTSYVLHKMNFSLIAWPKVPCCSDLFSFRCNALRNSRGS